VCFISFINIKDLEIGELAIFCGAGISKNSGLPLANELKLSILQKLNLTPDEINKLMNSNIPFESFMEIISEATDISKILEIFEQGKPNKTHLLIAKLAKMGIIKTIVTTNFDILIEKAFEQEGLRENIDFKRYFVEDQFNSMKPINSDDKIRIFKIHGTIDFKNSIRTTLNVIASKNLSKERFKILDNLFYSGSHDRVLIMGYSCSDIFDISPQIERIQNSLKEIIFIEHTLNQINEMVEDVKLKKEINPFRNFFGYRIRVDNDSIIDEVWKSYNFDNYNVPAPCFKWQTYVNKWNNQLNQDEGFNYFLTASLISEIFYYKKAANYFKKSLEISKEKQDHEAIWSCYQRLGGIYGRLGDFKTALNYTENALKIAKEKKYTKGQALSNSNIGVAYSNLGKFMKAIHYLNQAILGFQNIQDPIREAQCYGNIGVAYQQLKEFDKALEYHTKSLNLSRDYGHIKGELAAYNNIGTIYRQLKQYEKAISYHENALEISEKLGHKEGIFNSYFNLSVVYRHLSKLNLSQEYHEKMLKIVEDSDIPVKKKLYINLGEFEKTNGNFKESMGYFEKLIDIFNEIGDSASEAQCYKDIGFLYFQLEDYERSLEYHLKAGKLLKETRQFNFLKIIYNDLSIIYEILGNKSASDKFLKESMEL